jgi:hypothetical protein
MDCYTVQQRAEVKTSGLSFVFEGQNYDEMLMMSRVLHYPLSICFKTEDWPEESESACIASARGRYITIVRATFSLLCRICAL